MARALRSACVFWVTEDRRDRFLRACVRLRARGKRPGADPVVIAVETAAAAGKAGGDGVLLLLNTGSTLRGGGRTKRDEMTLQALRLWGGEHAVELAIRGASSGPAPGICLDHDLPGCFGPTATREFGVRQVGQEIAVSELGETISAPMAGVERFEPGLVRRRC